MALIVRVTLNTGECDVRKERVLVEVEHAQLSTSNIFGCHLIIKIFETVFLDPFVFEAAAFDKANHLHEEDKFFTLAILFPRSFPTLTRLAVPHLFLLFLLNPRVLNKLS